MCEHTCAWEPSGSFLACSTHEHRAPASARLTAQTDSSLLRDRVTLLVTAVTLRPGKSSTRKVCSCIFSCLHYCVATRTQKGAQDREPQKSLFQTIVQDPPVEAAGFIGPAVDSVIIDVTTSIRTRVCFRSVSRAAGGRRAGWEESAGPGCPGHTDCSQQFRVGLLQLVGNKSRFMSTNQHGFLKN